MSSLSRFSRLLAAVSALAMLGSGCAERPSIDDAGAFREVPPSTDESTTTNALDEPFVLRLAIDTTWRGDPADAGPTVVGARVVAGLLHEGLTSIDANGAVGPGLAERWFVSDDRLQWTFVLPEGLTDNLGLALTAADIKDSFERLAARGPADQAVVGLRPIAGWDDYVAGRSGGVAGLVAADVGTLVVVLNEPFEPLAEVLAAPAYGITGEADGIVRTTGDYRYETDERLVAVDVDAAVPEIELVRTDGDGRALLTADRVDWAVLGPRDVAANIPGTVIRQPLELRTGIVIRYADQDQRAAVMSVLNGTELALDLPNATVAVSTGATGSVDDLPAQVTVHVPDGPLTALAPELERQLTAAGVAVEIVVLPLEAFAAAVAAGEALVFPMVMAGSGYSRSATVSGSLPGGLDDVFGTNDDARRSTLAEIWSERDVARRSLLIAAAETRLLEQRLWLPIASAEVRIGLSAAMDPLRVLPDGTLDLSGF